jgi:deazaflavin-dependent oxidoreductase (nitroreductase family)
MVSWLRDSAKPDFTATGVVILIGASGRDTADGRSHKPLLGLRDRPGRLALAVFRLPLRAYHHDAGWLLGHTFLAFVYVGRKTGRSHEAVAMVLRYEAAMHEAVICAAWGPNTDWVRNLRASRATQVQIGRESFTPSHRFLSNAEALEVTTDFRRDHPWRLRLISEILGWGDLRDDETVHEFVASHPFVAFRPAPAPD